MNDLTSPQLYAAHPERDYIALSGAQRAIWLDLRLGVNPIAYQLSGRSVVHGLIDEALMGQAIQLLTASNDALRLRVDAHEPRQWLAAATLPPLRMTDGVGGADALEAAAAVDTIVARTVAEVMPLGDHPLFQFDVVRVKADQSIVIWRIHHLVADMITLDLIMQRWAEIYIALSADSVTALPAGSSFVAVIEADHAYTASAQAAADLAYWQRRFDVLPTSVFPIAPAVVTASVPMSWSLTGTDLARWRAACVKAGVTEQRALLSMLAVTLSRRAGVDDFTIGLALHGRDFASKDVIGMLSRALPVRCRVNAETSLSNTAKALSKALDEDFRHQRTPIDELCHAIGMTGGGQAGLYDAVLSYRQVPTLVRSLTVAGLKIELVGTVPLEMTPVSLYVNDIGDAKTPHSRMDLLLNHDPVTVDAASCHRLGHAFQQVMRQFSDAAGTWVGDVDAVTDEERTQLLQHWATPAVSDTVPGAAPAPANATLPALFRLQAAATPEVIALVDGDHTLTYAQLDAESERRARALRHLLQQSNPDVLEPVVGVALVRSMETVIWLWSILKAGAVYLPLDIDNPPSRLQFMLDNAQAVLLVTDTDTKIDFGATPRFDYSPSAQATDTPTEDLVRGPASAQSLAYVIYTSGSTGQPKAVAVDHHAAVNLAYARRAMYDPVSGQDRILAMSAVGFDVSVGQLILPLLSGSSIVICPPLKTLDARAFWSLMAHHRITQLDAVPSFFDAILDAQVQIHSGVQRVIVGGDACSTALARRLRAAFPHADIVNVYGPTETCIDATAFTVPKDECNGESADTQIAKLPAILPIGRPLPNYQAYVLDAQWQLSAIGAEGELFIGGPGLARGYLGQPAMTAEKFVPNPFSTAGERMYRTGDRVRWCEDGTLDYLGRADFQVKIRGQRIETGEIENALRSHPAVRQAAVVARQDDGAATKRLVAYLVGHGGESTAVDPQILRSYLAQHLTEAMLPSAFVWLDALPLNANGKIDTKALPAPQAHELHSQRPYEAPQGEVEETLAAMWQELLKVERVGRHDNFFELGGHSLLVVTLAERLRQRDWHVDIATLFARPSLATLAQKLGQNAEAGHSALVIPPNGIPANAALVTRVTPEMLPLLSAVQHQDGQPPVTQTQIDGIAALVPGGHAHIQDIYPLAPLQSGMLFHHLLETTGDAYLTSVTLSFQQASSVEGFLAALQVVINRHDMLRTAMHWDGLDTPVQVVWRSATLVVEDFTCTNADTRSGDAQTQLQTHFDARHYRIDLRQAPLMRAVRVFDAAKQRWLVLLMLHHLALDHASMELLMQEVVLIGRGLQAHLPPAMPFRNAVAHARLGVSTDEHTAFFKAQLSHIDEPTAPYGVLDVRADSADIHRTSLDLDRPLAQRLRQLARQHGVGSASLMHLAWAMVLRHTTGRETPVFGTVLLGRMQSGPGADRALGLFINTLPLCVSLGQATVQEALQATHQGLAELLHHEHAPLSLAQACSGVAAPLPLFTSLLNCRYAEASQVQQQQAEHSAWPDLQKVGNAGASNYPIAMSVDDQGEGDSFTLTAEAIAKASPQRLCDMMHAALRGMADALEAAQPQKCALIPLMRKADKALLLQVWKSPSIAAPLDETLHALIRAQALATPDAIAVIDGEQHLSFAALNALSDRRARQICYQLDSYKSNSDKRYPAETLQNGLASAPENAPVIGLAIPRSLESVVWLLSILKAGGVYLPLDVDYPANRLGYMLQDAGAALVIVESAEQGASYNVDASPSTSANIPLLITSNVSAPQADLPADDHPQRSQRLAYIIYTSGSTGTPKAVGITHSGAINLAYARKAGYDPVVAGDRILAMASVGFDVSFGQLALPLLSGATTVICPPLKTLDAHAFWDLIERHGITQANSVPSFFEAVLAVAKERTDQRTAQGRPPTTLKRIIVGGEAFNQSLARQLRAALPDTDIVNVYGPTETSIDATTFSLPKGDLNGESADTQIAQLPAILPIGRPLPNYQAYVLDAQWQLSAIGVEGELFIGGPGLARGYLGQPAMTAEKFVPNPFSTAGERMYRTGDRVRWCEDGTLDYLGRADFQVKIRGQRIETGEIENALRSHPAVRQAAVVARQDDGAATKRLVAYLVGHAGESTAVDPQILRSYLAQHLTEAMLPSAFVWLDALPLNANGKIDTKALPAPQAHELHSQRPYEAPQGEVEETLAAMWQELLKVERVGRHDNFFELGGHSLLVVTLAERLRQRDWHVDIATLFARPSLATLAEKLGQNAEAGHSALVIPPNGIPANAALVTRVTPEMLPLLSAVQHQDGQPPVTQTQIDGIAALVPGGHAHIQDIYPLAPLQSGMLFHHLLETTGDAYLTSVTLSFQQASSVEGFLAALQVVINRHDMLRTAMHWDGLDTPVQVVWRSATLVVEDFTCTNADTRSGDAQTQLQTHFDARHYRIDLRQAPLMRAVRVFDAAKQRWLVLLMLHHLALDHASMELLMQEVVLIGRGLQAHLPPAMPFRNAVAHAHLGVGADAHRAFFGDMLGAVDEPTAPFGLRDVRADGADMRQAVQPVEAALGQRLRQHARSHGVSSASLMHLAWGLVLRHTTGRESPVFGTVLLGRMQSGPGADRALGLFINTLPVCLELNAVSVAEALGHTHERLAQLLHHEHAPLALAQSCSALPQGVPLFTTLLNCRYSQQAQADKASLQDSAWPDVQMVANAGASNYPLAMSVDELGEDGFTLTANAVAPVTPTRLCDLMQAALSALDAALTRSAAGQAVNCNDLDVMPNADKHSVLQVWKSPSIAAPLDETLHALIRAQALATPDAIAVIDGEQHLSFAALNALSDRRARQICYQLDSYKSTSDKRYPAETLQNGLASTPENAPVIGLAIPRSLESVVWLLSILKAGGVYLPLDVDYPANRLGYMLQDAGAALVIVESAEQGASYNVDASPSTSANIPLLITSNVSAPQADLPADDHPQRSQRLAYIIYTSGSTGTPKAVGITHSGAINLAYARKAGYDPVVAGDRILAMASVGFDVSFGQLALPLLSGATTVICPPLKTLDAHAFWDLIERHGITQANSVPSFFEAVLAVAKERTDQRTAQGRPPTTLKRIIVGGEAFNQSLARQLRAALPDTDIVNVYGPTETSIDATTFSLPKGDLNGESADTQIAQLPAILPIGRPLPNYQAYVLDAQWQLSAIGVEGELFIGGPGLARGYLGQPAMTAEKFVPNPFSTAGERMYRTGDRVRWCEDGTLDYLGRADFQVKIRGQRIETGEIENALRSHPAVRQAAVVARQDDGAATKRLVAYLVGHAGESTAVDPQILRSYLAQHLTEAMLPSAFVWLDALPLNANGKIDTKALPAPTDYALAAMQSVYVAPRTETETALQTVWQQVLGRVQVGVEDNFFDIGGHSLMAIRLNAACNAALKADLPLRSLFALPTIAAMAAMHDNKRSGASTGLLVPLRATGARRPVFVIHPYGGTVFCYNPLVRALDADIPVYGLQAQGIEAGEVPLTRMEDMAATYLAHIQTQQVVGPYQIVGYSLGGLIASELVRQLQAQGETVSLLALLDAPIVTAEKRPEPTLAQVIADAMEGLGGLVSLAPDQIPQTVEAMVERLAEHGADFSVADCERLVDVSLKMLIAADAYTVPVNLLPPDVTCLQVRATQSIHVLSDWRTRLGAAVATHDLDCDHAGLVSTAQAATLAALIAPHLA